MDVHLVASIIQGEAGGLGPLGMVAVALSLHCRMWQHGHDEGRIAREFYGRAEPGPVALLLAGLVLERRLPDNSYYFCMGGELDVAANGWRAGEAMVMIGNDPAKSLHLYPENEPPWEVDDDEDAG